MVHLDLVLILPRGSGVSLKIRKSCSPQSYVEALGQVRPAHRLAMAQHNVDVIRDSETSLSFP